MSGQVQAFWSICEDPHAGQITPVSKESNMGCFLRYFREKESVGRSKNATIFVFACSEFHDGRNMPTLMLFYYP
jgi:hypothetical protein